MADPITIMAGVSMAAGAAGGILGAVGAARKDDASAAMYQYKAGVAAANQKIAAQNASYAIQTGGVKAQDVGLAGMQRLGQIKTEQAASGIDVNTGTAAKVRTSQLTGIQTDEARVMANSLKEAYGYQVQGMNFTAEGVLDTQAAQFAQQQKGLDVASSLLGGAGSVADKWMKYSTAGISGYGGSPGSSEISGGDVG